MGEKKISPISKKTLDKPPKVCYNKATKGGNTMADEKRISQLMTTLNCSREEALDVLRADAEIDGGKRVEFDLSPEEEKRAKKYANVDTHKKPINFKPRERKPNELKEAIVAEIAQILTENVTFGAKNVEITNKNRMIAFSVGEKHFEFTLVEKRPPKNGG